MGLNDLQVAAAVRPRPPRRDPQKRVQLLFGQNAHQHAEDTGIEVAKQDWQVLRQQGVCTVVQHAPHRFRLMCTFEIGEAVRKAPQAQRLTGLVANARRRWAGWNRYEDGGGRITPNTGRAGQHVGARTS